MGIFLLEIVKKKSSKLRSSNHRTILPVVNTSWLPSAQVRIPWCWGWCKYYKWVYRLLSHFFWGHSNFEVLLNTTVLSQELPVLSTSFLVLLDKMLASSACLCTTVLITTQIFFRSTHVKVWNISFEQASYSVVFLVPATKLLFFKGPWALRANVTLELT